MNFMHRRNLEQSKQQRQQSTSASAGDKEDGGEHGNDATSSEDGSALESTTCTTLSDTSNSISEAVTVPAQPGRTLRTRRLTSKSVPRRLRSTRREFTSFYRQSDSDRDLKNGDDEDDDNNNNDDDGNGSGSSRMRRFARLPKPSVSRMIADKILTKSIARTRKKRYAAAVATDALKRIKESSSTGGKRRLGEDDDGNYDKDDSNNIDDDDDGDDDNDDGDNNDGDDEVDDTDKEKGRTHARKKHCSSDDNDDDKSHPSDKKMDVISGSGTSRKSERKRQGLRDKEVEPMTKKRSKDIDDTKKVRFLLLFPVKCNNISFRNQIFLNLFQTFEE